MTTVPMDRIELPSSVCKTDALPLSYKGFCRVPRGSRTRPHPVYETGPTYRMGCGTTAPTAVLEPAPLRINRALPYRIRRRGNGRACGTRTRFPGLKDQEPNP
jgi:hypothetical protein